METDRAEIDDTSNECSEFVLEELWLLLFSTDNVVVLIVAQSEGCVYWLSMHRWPPSTAQLTSKRPLNVWECSLLGVSFFVCFESVLWDELVSVTSEGFG